MRVITSQRYRDCDKVEAKMAELAGTDSITLPVIEVGMDDLYILTDGHHAYTAATELGIPVSFRVVDATEDDRAALDAETMLEAMWMDGDYIDLATGEEVF